MKKSLLILGGILGLTLGHSVHAEEASDKKGIISLAKSDTKNSEIQELEEVIVKEQKSTIPKIKLSIKPESFPSKVDIITSEELKSQIIPRHEEIFRKIPGIYVENYGQGDIGSAITMRGLGGGGGGKRYVATYIDDVPQNYPIYFGDQIITWLIPEMIEKIEIVKGPFSPFCGDNSIGGCFNIITKNEEKLGFLGSIGSYDSYRAVPILSYQASGIKSFALAEYYKTNGYRDNSEYQRYNFFGKISIPIRENYLSSLRLSYYDADWDAPGYLSLSELKKGLVRKRETLTPQDGGDSKIWSIVLRVIPKEKEEGIYFTSYYTEVNLNRFVAFPLYKTSPLRQQARIFDTQTWGAKAYYHYKIVPSTTMTFGMEFRYDDGTYIRYPTKERKISGNYTQYWDAIYKQVSPFIMVQFKPIEKLKFLGGLRYNKFDYEVKNKVVVTNSGKGDTEVVSPKLGLIYSPLDNFEVYGNWAKGARAPYINEVSPPSSSQKANFNLRAAEISSWDIGLRILLKRLNFEINYYDTGLKREIAIVNNEPINIGHTKRKGLETELRFLIFPEIIVYGSYSLVNAKVKNPQIEGQDKVIDVPKNIFKFGVDYIKEFSLNRSFLANFIYYYTSGKYYYYKTSPEYIKGPVYDRYMLNLTYTSGKFKNYLSITFVPRKYASQITWLNENEIQVNPEPKWNLSLGVKYEF